MVIPSQVRAGIFAGESGGDYDALYGYSNRRGPFAGVKVTDMTINDVIRFTDPNAPYAQWVKGQVGRVATPVGAYQVVGSTLRDAVRGLGLTGNEKFDQATQDAIGAWIYQTQGTGAWEGYKGPRAGGAEMRPGLLSMSTSGMPEQQPRSFGDRLRAGWQSGELMDNLALAFNSMRLNPDPNIGQMVDRRAERRSQSEAVNRTAAWLEAQGRPDLAEAVRRGMIDGAAAFTVMNQKPEDNRTALIQNYEYARSMGFSGSFEDFMRSGGGGGSVVNVGPTGIDYGTPPKDMAWARNPDGSVKLDERGVPMALPIQNTTLATNAAAATAATERKAATEQTYNDVVLDTIDTLIGSEDGKTPAMITSGEGLTNFSNVGTAASKTVGVLQGPTNVARTIDTIKSSIVLGRLQAMKDASATGASGMGSLTEKEVDLLASSLGSLSVELDAATLRQNLENIRRIWSKLNADPQARALYYSLGQQGAAPAGGGDDFTVTEQF